MAGKSYKIVQSEMSLEALHADFGSECEELASEAREIVDNAPEALREVGRNAILTETADTLENLSLPDLPDLTALDLPATIAVSQFQNRNKRQGTSRAVRLENACLLADALCDAVGTRCDELEEDEDALSDAQEDAIEETRQFVDELTAAKDEAEGVEFPGMFG